MPRTVNQWFDPAAFATPANGSWGNAGRGIIEGPGYVLFNLGLQKTRAAGEIGRCSSWWRRFNNILNHTNLGEPSGGGSPLPGQVRREQRERRQDHLHPHLPPRRLAPYGPARHPLELLTDPRPQG